MKAYLPIIIQDPSTSREANLPTVEGMVAEDEFFLDGPVSRRVAVLDFDPDPVKRAGVVFVPPKKGGKEGGYDVRPGQKIRDP